MAIFVVYMTVWKTIFTYHAGNTPWLTHGTLFIRLDL